MGSYKKSASSDPVECELVLHEHAVYIYLKDEAKSLLIWDLAAVTSMRWSGGDLVIHKDDADGASLICMGEMARLIEKANTHLPHEKPKERFNHALLFLYGFPILGFISLCLLGYFIVLPWVAERSVSLVSVDTEIAIGAHLEKTYAQEEVANDSATYYCTRFLQALSLPTVYPLRVKVIQSPEINAFALPGGNMVIYTGILEKMDSYEELAALLSHEATHVIRRHSLKSVFRSIAASLLISNLFGGAGGVSAAVLNQADQFKQLDYSRQLETEADLNGLDLMVQSNINPQGMLDLLTLLKKEGAEQPQLMKYLSTHPDTGERITAVKNKMPPLRSYVDRKELKVCFAALKKTLDTR